MYKAGKFRLRTRTFVRCRTRIERRARKRSTQLWYTAHTSNGHSKFQWMLKFIAVIQIQIMCVPVPLGQSINLNFEANILEYID